MLEQIFQDGHCSPTLIWLMICTTLFLVVNVVCFYVYLDARNHHG